MSPLAIVIVAALLCVFAGGVVGFLLGVWLTHLNMQQELDDLRQMQEGRW